MLDERMLSKRLEHLDYLIDRRCALAGHVEEVVLLAENNADNFKTVCDDFFVSCPLEHVNQRVKSCDDLHEDALSFTVSYIGD